VAWDRRPVPALTLRPAPLPWVAALRALPAVVIAVAGGAWLALAVGVAFGVDVGSGVAVWIAVAGACACVSGVMIGGGGNVAGAAVVAVAAIGAAVLAVQADSNPLRPAAVPAPALDKAPALPRATPAPPPSARRETHRPSATARAGKLVRSYYAAIDAGDFAAAWARLSPGVQAGFGGFDTWRGGYATTLNQRVEGVEVDGSQIRHVLVARDRTPCGTTVEQRFAVTWTVAGGRATALHAVRLAGQDPAAAC
jgi:ketosteroid isomerase-like protein